MFLLISGVISVCACIGLALYCALAPSKQDAHDRTLWIFANSSYYIILGIVVLWAAQLIIYLRSRAFSPRDFLKRNWPELTFALLATVICFMSVQSEFRVMSDEANLLSVSENLLLRKKALNIVQAEHYFGNLHVIQESPDKRPLLFPFLVCLIHLVRGFNPTNSFVANGLVFYALLAGAAVTVQRLVGRAAAFAAVILLASYPLISLCATSGGFDLIAAVFLCASLLTLAVFMKEPSAEGFALLWITLLMLSQTREESAGWFPTVVTIVAAFGYLRREYFEKYAYLYAATPWILMIRGFQLALTLGGTSEGYEGHMFSPEHILKNADEALGTFRNFSYELPYSTVLNILALCCLVWLTLALILGRISLKAAWQRHFLASIVVVSAGLLLVLFSYFFGRATHPSAARVFTYFAIVAALLPVVFHYYFPSVMNSFVLVGIACVSAILYHSVSIEDRFANTQHIIRETAAEYDFLEKNRVEFDYLSKINDKRFLIVADRPVDFTAMGYGSVDFGYANSHYVDIMTKINTHLYLGLIFFQRMEYGKNEPIDACKILVPYDLSVVQKLEIRGSDTEVKITKSPDGTEVREEVQSPGEYLQISVVKSAD